ncbi:MAG: 3-hydroxyacyl-CoA dehydrogenase NAD-binding domain-containing protein [Candidatus Promineifilaceae bacterium]|nr:3-hydroxyacyl-CoA dehydrogenase NAD-binding domain-containing protein [Candidatus Promineifilaceae bacterium]
MTTDRVNSVAIMGAGTMGPGMAVVFAVHGYETRLMDISAEVLDKAQNNVEMVFNVLKNNDFITGEQIAAARERLSFTLDQAEAVSGVDLVAEAIPENLELKHKFYREVEEQVADGTILASNTSGLPITSLAEVCRRPERVVGMHWSNPPHIIPVIEVIKGEKTADETVAALWAVIEDIEMLPVLVRRDVAGFVENRVLYAIMRECLHLLESGIATAEDIDTVVKWGIGYKLAVIGPMELLDVAGLDIYHSVASYLNQDLSNEANVSSLVSDKVREGQLGIKTMGGLFNYEPQDLAPLMQRRMNLLLDTKKVLADWL